MLWLGAFIAMPSRAQEAVPETAAAAECRIVAQITGMPSPSGQVRILVLSPTSDFSLQSPQVVARSAADADAAILDIALGALPGGDYALLVWHDANGNGELDTNFIGIPKEAVGASNNPAARPTFANSRFACFGSVLQTVRIRTIF